MKQPAKRRGRVTPQPNGSILQVMSGRRIRLDPTTVESIAVWLLAAAMPWERGSARVLNGLGPSERDAAIGHIRWCRHATGAVQAVVGRLLDTLSLDDIETARERIKGAFALPDALRSGAVAVALPDAPELVEGR